LINKLLQFGIIKYVLREGNIYHIYYEKDFKYKTKDFTQRTSHLIVAEQPLRKINLQTRQVEQEETKFVIYTPTYRPERMPQRIEDGKKLTSTKPSLSQMDENWEVLEDDLGLG